VQQAADRALVKWSPEHKRTADLNRSFQGPGFVSPSERPVGETTRLFEGQILLANDTGAWYPAEIVELMPDGQVRVTFRGWGNARDKAVPRSRLQLAPDDVAQPNLSAAQLAELRGRSVAEPAGATPTAAAAGMRIWTDNTGTYKIEAVYAGLDDGKVKLKRKDGREVAVPLDRLSEADQKLVEELRKKPVAPNPFEP
jgi:hypothetical protein